jgi:amidase
MDDELRWWSAKQIAAAIRSKALSEAEVLEATIDRIERIDPQLGAVVIPLFDRARAKCGLDSGDGEEGAGFRGVPTLLKDAGEELAGTPHWVGTQGLAAAGHLSTNTTVLAHRFENLGFVIVGKSACPELSASSTTEPKGFRPLETRGIPVELREVQVVARRLLWPRASFQLLTEATRLDH